MFKKFNGEPTDFTNTLCGSVASDSGTNTDFLSAIGDSCRSIAGALDTVRGQNDVNPDTPEGKAKDAELMCKMGTGNVTWAVLGGPRTPAYLAGGDNEAYARKIILMNMMGASLYHDGGEGASCETANGVKVTDSGGNEKAYCPPTVNAKDISGMFMCGTDTAAIANTKSRAVADYCSQFFSNTTSEGGTASFSGVQAASLMVCDGDKIKCDKLVLKPYNEAGILPGEGFLPRVSRLLSMGVEAVRTNKEMPPEVISLMQTAPYPLYQAINAAAVYPVAASDLLDSISILVAESSSANMMEEFIRWHGREGSSICTSEEQVRRVLDTLATARANNTERRHLIAQTMVTQNALKEQIRMVNLAVQQQVMTTDLLHQNALASEMLRSVTVQGTSEGAKAGPTVAP